VQDVHQVEKKLDSMVFGGLKMFVNTTKFGRPKRENSQTAARGRNEGKHHPEGSRDTYLRMMPETKVNKGRMRRQ